MNTVDKVLTIAENEVGYLEKASSANLDHKTLNAGKNNYTKYGYEMHNLYPQVMDFPAPWCDCFVDWCFYKAYGIKYAKELLCGDFDDYTVNSAQKYKSKNRYFRSNPQIGDQIFFTNSTRICHTGLVWNVDDKYVYTIEGNTSSASGVVANGGGVAKKKYYLTYNNIDGYGRPNYDISKIPACASGNPVLGLNSNSYQVILLQLDLNYLMKTKLETDGIFGNNTLAALKLFQAKYNLKIDGKYGEDTSRWMKIYLGQNNVTPEKPHPFVAKPTLKLKSTGNQVVFLQDDLNYIMDSNLKADGIFGEATLNALKEFQKKHGLAVDGIYGLDSYSKMKHLLL